MECSNCTNIHEITNGECSNCTNMHEITNGMF